MVVDPHGALQHRRWAVGGNPATPLTNGNYTFFAREMDVAGNVSTNSGPIAVTILVRNPGTPTLTLVAADDTGVVGDNITNINRPRLTGTAQSAGLTVELILDSGSIYGPDGKTFLPAGAGHRPGAGARRRSSSPPTGPTVPAPDRRCPTGPTRSTRSSATLAGQHGRQQPAVDPDPRRRASPTRTRTRHPSRASRP